MLIIDCEGAGSSRLRNTVSIGAKIVRHSSIQDSNSNFYNRKKSPTINMVRRQETERIGELSFNGS
jgi:hypothetical protein